MITIPIAAVIISTLIASRLFGPDTGYIDEKTNF
jgi:hypothetical protein